MTLDAVQPGSLIPAPSISSKLEVCNKESKNQPHKHTHTSVEQAGCLGDVGKVLHFLRQRNTCYNMYPFKLYESVLRAFFPRLLSAVSSVKDKEECKELSVERGHSR